MLYLLEDIKAKKISHTLRKLLFKTYLSKRSVLTIMLHKTCSLRQCLDKLKPGHPDHSVHSPPGLILQ